MHETGNWNTCKIPQPTEGHRPHALGKRSQHYFDCKARARGERELAGRSCGKLLGCLAGNGFCERRGYRNL
ncbi:hypothetical protein LSUB1_G006554 [Lachnellula subtilissima]|uniref:Uncharacterized protein n=1 Tax=Lachnellula subtilissima TaxID=602034 RepID=A0A8H8RE69_9HELO|nr:hypothetical protein LSUB1_G006554 [Lachnellula subtilissima]